MTICDASLKRTQERFLTDLAGAWEDQYQWCTFYKNRCEKAKISLSQGLRSIEAGDIGGLPALESGLWKRSQGIFRELSRPGRGGSWAISSSTSRDPSCRWYSLEDLHEVNTSFMRAFQKIPVSVDMLALLTPSLQELERFFSLMDIGEGPALPFMIHPIRSSFTRFGEIQFISLVHGENPKKQHVDSEHLSRVLRKAHAERQVLAIGYSVLFLEEAIRHPEFRKYAFDDRLYILTGGGGWNGSKGEIARDEVGKPEFITTLARTLGLSDVERQVVDIYSTAETGKAHSGYYSRTLGDFTFDTDSSVRLFVVDPVHGEPVEVDESGVPRWISPYGVSGSASAVIDQVDDRITVKSIGSDGSVTRFSHINRAPSGPESELTAWMEREWDGCPIDLLERATRVMMK